MRTLALFLTLFVGAMLIAQETPSPVVPPSITVPNIDERLASLDGTDAMAYFRLAEEVASEIPGDRGVKLARTLYVLAFELSRDESGAPTLTRSVSLGLASLEPPTPSEGVGSRRSPPSKARNRAPTTRSTTPTPASASPAP